MSHNHTCQQNRRQFLRALALAGGGLAAAGCGLNAPAPGAPAAPLVGPTITANPSATYTPFPAPTAAPATATMAASPTASPTVLPSPTPWAKATVAIGKAENYDPQVIRKTLQTMLDGLGGIGDVVRPGARVAIKVNLTGGTEWIRPGGLPATEVYITHPEVVRALCQLLRDAGASKIAIVEGIYEADSWPAWGWDAVAKSVGAELIDLNGFAPYASFTEARPAHPLVYERLTVNPILTEIDTFISVAKMKVHYTAGITLAMKNLVGLAPLGVYRKKESDNSRTAIHGSLAKGYDEHLIRAILDLNQARPVNLAVIDGVLTSDGGEGPWQKHMQPVQAGILLAGKDPVATDAVGTAMMGFDPAAADLAAPFIRSENYLRMAAEAGLGTNRLAEIQVVGAEIEAVRKPFRMTG